MKYSKRIALAVLSAITLFAVTSCNNNASSSTSTSQLTPSSSISSSSATSNYEQKEVNVYYKNMAKNHKTKLRFYEETNDIPYIGIKQFYNILVKDTALSAKGDLTVTKDGNLYKVTSIRGGVAEINTVSDTFRSDNYALFSSTNYGDFSQETSGFLLDGLPFVKVKKVTYNREATPFVVDFTKYKINLFGDNDDVYFPFNTVSDLFLSENLLNCSYNQKDIYVIDGAKDQSIESFSNYHNPIFAKKLSKEYSEYNYMEMCFAYDKLLGRPNRSSFERLYNQEKGLDYALSNDDMGKELKKLFLSSDVADYFLATQMCYSLFADGGHTTWYQLAKYTALLNEEESEAFTSTYLELLNKVAVIKEKKYAALVQGEVSVSDHLLVRSSREKMLGLTLDEGNSKKKLIGNNSYHKKGSTAIISIDDFMGEIESLDYWKKYYNGEIDSIPFGNGVGGCVGAIYNGLKKAKEDNVKNVIIDLASNTGGSVDELAYLCAIVTQKKKITYFNTVTNQILTAELDIDINLDKKFDEDDDISMVEGFNIAVLESKCGFSCGGISPIYLHEANIFTMGQESGGGSCSIYYMYDVYGLPHVASSPHLILTLNGAPIDAIRNTSCDLKLEIPEVNGVKNYDAFYDLDKLTEYITDHYNK